MADQPGLQPQPAAPAAPAPAANPPPAAPAGQPPVAPPKPDAPPASPASQQQPLLSPDQVLEISGPDGTTNYARLSDLVSAYQNRTDLDASEVDQLRTIRDAVIHGKPEALQKLVTSFNQPGQPGAAPASAPGSPDNSELQSLRQQVQSMQEALNEARGVTGQISALQERNAIQAMVTTYSQQVPLTAKLGESGAERVRREFHNQVELAKQGQHPDFPGTRFTSQNFLPQHRDKILARSMMTVEGEISSLASGLGMTLQPAAVAQAAPAASAGQPVLVDDQTEKPNFRQAAYRYDRNTGQIVSSTGQPMVQNRRGDLLPATGGVVPSTGIPGPGTGGAPLPAGAPQSAQRTFVDHDGLVRRMEQRRQAFGGQ